MTFEERVSPRAPGFFHASLFLTSTRRRARLIRRGGTSSFDAEQIRVERLAAVMDLGGYSGVVLVQPFGDAPGVGRSPPFALDERDDLVVIGEELGEQAGRRLAQGGSHHFDARSSEPEEIAFGDRTGRTGRRPYRPGDLAGRHP